MFLLSRGALKSSIRALNNWQMLVIASSLALDAPRMADTVAGALASLDVHLGFVLGNPWLRKLPTP